MLTLRFVLVQTLVLTFAATAVTLDESPAKPEEWGYRPAEEFPAEVNPPGFSWRPVEDAASYLLEIATDEGFGDVIYRASSAWSAHGIAEVLPTETPLYWRYAARDAHGGQSDWSQSRRFTIAADAVAFPRPPQDTMLKMIPESHPRLFFRPEHVDGLRNLAQGRLEGEFAELREAADKLLAAPPDTTEPPLYPDGMQRKSGAWKEIWWGNRTRTIAVIDGAALLGFVYQLTGEETYAHGARDLLMAVASWDPEGATNYEYNDEAAMPVLYMASRAYSWAYPVLTAEEREAVTKMMRTRGQHAFDHLRNRRQLWNPYASHSNRAWHFLGELAIAFYGDIPEAPTWLDYATTIFYTAYPVWSDTDGGWHEGAAYWSSYLGRFMYWALTMRAMFDVDVFERPFFKKTGYFGMYIAPPGAKTAGFGDQAGHMTSNGLASLVGTLAMGARNPYWKWYAEQHGGADPGGYVGFILAAHAGELEAAPPTDLPSSRYFAGVGIAALNTNLLDGKDNLQLVFKSSPMGRVSHGYNANNAFILNLHGSPALVRSGRRDVHGSPHHRQWMWHSKSDNAILVNGEGQIKHSPMATGRIVAFDTTPEVDVVVGEAGDSYSNLDRWTRRIVFLKEYAIVIHDILRAPEPSTFSWLVHSAAEMGIDGQRLSYSADNGAFELELLHPEGLEISQTDEFDPPPAAWTKWDLGQWHITAHADEKVENREFIAVIRTSDSQVDLDMDGTSLAIATPDGTATYSWTTEGFTVERGDYRKSF